MMGPTIMVGNPWPLISGRVGEHLGWAGPLYSREY
jgi:hypothetical protein